MTDAPQYEIAQVRELPIGLELLVLESEAEGFDFLRRLVAEWKSGANRFSQPGEAFFVATRGERVVGVAGLNIDPYEGRGRTIGRVRHVYVAAAERRRGVGRALLRRVVDRARESFSDLHLRTDSPAASAFYESCRFSRAPGPGAFTHRLPLRDAQAIATSPHLLGSAVILIVAFAGSLKLFELVWHRSALEDVSKQAGGWIGAILIVACSAVIHESLHALGWRIFARVPWRSISFRPSWRVMGFVAHVDVPASATAHRASTALPALVLGLLPIVLGLATGFGLILLWGLFFLLECFFDMAVILSKRKDFEIREDRIGG